MKLTNISMCLSTYLNNVLTKFKMQDGNPISTPSDKFIIDENIKLYSIPSKEYRHVNSSLILYAMMCTRPDLCELY